MSCWGCDSLSRIASAIGTPLFVDENQSRISFARMLIQVNVTKSLPTLYGREFTQAVEYDYWKPQFCAKCLKIRHMCTTMTTPEAPHPFEQLRSRRRPRRVLVLWATPRHQNLRTIVSPTVATVTSKPIPTHQIMLDPGAGGITTESEA
ncbi:hypothetical protein H5410_040237 [Solanum commersonii]|uniref:Uncharacterized protein n=1 Tax=Solanum commersonii TaxID=4109 RepID=A0A9J5XNB2_SOLCO|nr:hypothetical protein H5410_040237 [Solanum commersonii]